MDKKKTDNQSLKDFLKLLLIMFIGIAFTTASFLVYYLVQPNKWIWLSILFVFDFAYVAMSVLFAFYYKEAINYKILKCILVPTVYVIIFTAAPIIALTLGGAFEMIANNIVAFVVYAFCTAPGCLVVIAIVGFAVYLLSLHLTKEPVEWYD